MRVVIVCLPVRGAPGECYYTLYYVVIIFHRRVWYRALSLRYACIQSSGIILIPS